MTVLVCRQEAAQSGSKTRRGTLSPPVFHDRGGDGSQLQAMGYSRLLTAYPVTQIVAGPGMDPAELGAVFLERPLVQSWSDGSTPAR